MWRLDTPVRAGDEDVVAAVVERRWEITKEDPVWESVIVKALAADKTRAKRRKMVWYVFIVVNYCAMGIGAAHMRVQLIKKAKVNGDILGFLV